MFTSTPHLTGKWGNNVTWEVYGTTILPPLDLCTAVPRHVSRDFARRLLRRGRTGPGQGIVGRLKVAEDYQRLYINNRDKITFIAKEDNKQNEALQQIRQIIFK